MIESPTTRNDFRAIHQKQNFFTHFCGYKKKKCPAKVKELVVSKFRLFYWPWRALPLSPFRYKNFLFSFILNRINFIICCRRTCSSVLKMPSLTLTVLLHFTMEWPWPAALSVVWPAFQPCAAQHRNDDPRINFKILFHFLSNFILHFFFLKFGFQHFHGRFFGYRSRWIGHFIGHGIV